MFMPTQPKRNRLRVAGAPLAAVLLCAAVSACGSSSKAKTATNSTSAVTYASVTSAAAPSAASAPTHASGSTGGSSNGGTPSSNGGSPNSGNSGASKNTQNTSTQQQHSNTNSKYPPALVAALKSFAGCVRSHGLNIGEPNLSGHGEVFSSKGVNSNSPSYRRALEGCEGQLLAILRIASGSHAKLPGVG